MGNSSAVSLANFSIRSVHGSEYDGNEAADVESVISTRVQGDDPGGDEGSGSEASNSVPPLNKDQVGYLKRKRLHSFSSLLPL